ncbi:MAG: hypothetical protein LBH58_10015 [Tannerellaceae bacterium]|jgi:hypothetical protein|nr:hypothetical protein [Tannerellaceae bacterium]
MYPIIFIRKVIKAFVPYGIISLLRYIHIVKNQGKHKLTSGTINENKTFYIIRRPEPGAGLFSNFHWVLGHIIYALERNYIPVVDMENYKTYYNEDSPINGTKNAWEYYFNQPLTYNLEEAYKSKNVILSEMKYCEEKIPRFLEFEEQIEYFHKLITKYMSFNDITLSTITEAKSRLFGNKKNILGVLYRGTDYVKNRPEKHAVVAPINDYIDKTKKYVEEWKMDWIYLETEEAEVVDLFRKNFPDKLIISNSMRIRNYSVFNDITPAIRFNRKQDKYLRGLEYLIDTVLLSECDAIIGPKVNGTLAAVGLNGNKYKHKYIYELGNNPSNGHSA